MRGCIRIRILFFKKIFVGSVLTDTRKISVFVFEYGIGDMRFLTDIGVIFFLLLFVFKTDLRWGGGFVFGQQLQLETSQTTMHACASGHSAGLWRPVSRHRTGKLPIKAACCADVLFQVASQCNSSPRSSFFPDFCRCCTPPPSQTSACPTYPAPPHGTCDAPHPMIPHYLAVGRSLA